MKNMKKILLTLAVVMCACATVSAQGWLGTVKNSVTDSRNWATGVRVGSGFQVQAEYLLRSENYVEGRFGMSWCNAGSTLTADFTVLYNWHIAEMDWTPDVGTWFFDAGCGVVVGGRSHYAYFGPAGSAKFGIKFNGAPFKLAIDWTPYIGPGISYGISVPVYGTDTMTGTPVITGQKKVTSSSFNEHGFANFGLSCVYYF